MYDRQPFQSSPTVGQPVCVLAAIHPATEEPDDDDYLVFVRFLLLSLGLEYLKILSK